MQSKFSICMIDIRWIWIYLSFTILRGYRLAIHMDIQFNHLLPIKKIPHGMCWKIGNKNHCELLIQEDAWFQWKMTCLTRIFPYMQMGHCPLNHECRRNQKLKAATSNQYIPFNQQSINGWNECHLQYAQGAGTKWRPTSWRLFVHNFQYESVYSA